MAPIADVESDDFFTPSGVRLRARTRRPGGLNWLFLPGGPGIGSESLHELVDGIDVPGTAWMVDLPGDGSNVDAPGAPDDPYQLWPAVLLEAATGVENPVYVGHSTGGMYLLSTPALEGVIRGMALLSTAPDSSWLPVFTAMTENEPLPGVALATATYEKDPTAANLAAVAVESAPWNFGPETVDIGADLLARMPYNADALAWSDREFDRVYRSSWWPRRVPTLVVSGTDDRIVTQALWDDARYHTDSVVHCSVSGGGHFPWIDNPGAVRAAFSELTTRITG